jgi:hypothetical protein
MAIQASSKIPPTLGLWMTVVFLSLSMARQNRVVKEWFSDVSQLGLLVDAVANLAIYQDQNRVVDRSSVE